MRNRGRIVSTDGGARRAVDKGDSHIVERNSGMLQAMMEQVVRVAMRCVRVTEGSETENEVALVFVAGMKETGGG